jgi:5-methylcytosine-specific restriction enzyme B
MEGAWETMMVEYKKDEFSELFKEFAASYPNTRDGQEHIEKYRTGRQQAQESYESILSAADRGDDITEQVVLKLLPHADTKGNRERGGWIHIAPAINKDIKDWFEQSDWAKKEDWPHIAREMLSFIRRCVDHPEELEEACEGFSQSPYSTGLQMGMMTPILNALRPDTFVLINSKSRHTLNFLTDASFGNGLKEYPEFNAFTQEILRDIKEEIESYQIPGISNIDLFDMFTHWCIAIKKIGGKPRKINYWKIAPGESGWNWDNCRKNGFIAIGWEKLGDVSKLNRDEFNELRDRLVAENADWKKGGANQVWTFAHSIKAGDQIVANRGTKEVLGIGTVKGSYEYVSDVRHGHRLPVKWEDVEPREVIEEGWRRTLVKLDQQKFNEIKKAPIHIREKDGPVFSEKTFELLRGLHETPTAQFYQENKDQFKAHVEQPLKDLHKEIVDRLSPRIREVMETQKWVFAQIQKNDYGQGGAWDFYWGAIYPKGGKRLEDAQLAIGVHYERLEVGFYVGVNGKSQRRKFEENCRKNYEELCKLLATRLDDSRIIYGRKEDYVEGSDGKPKSKDDLTWKGWLQNPEKADYDASVFYTEEEVLKHQLVPLAEEIVDLYEKMFPLVFLAMGDDPMPEIRAYIGKEPERTENPTYSLEKYSEETGCQLGTLKKWVRAIERKKQVIFYGPPGTGKTYVANKLADHLVGGSDGLKEIVQFHPAYSYEDFIQGIRPQSEDGEKLTYPVVPGRFLEFCKQAESRAGQCVLIIDEINRANISEVFGELMFLLEYRDQEIPLAGGIRFRIPDNVFIVGTMNTADRSIALVDHALRRRFAFLKLGPNYDVLQKYLSEIDFPVESLIKVLQNMNRQIGDPHYEIGISFFLRTDLSQQIKDIWEMEIEPYLEEFFFDQPEKVNSFRWDTVEADITNE